MEFVGREGETQERLGKGGDDTAESVGHGEGRFLASLNWDESTFMEVDGEPIGGREVIKDPLEVCNMLRDQPDNDGAEEVIHVRVEKEAPARSLKGHLLQYIHMKEGRGSPCRRPRQHWIHLPETPLRRTIVWLRLSILIQVRQSSGNPLDIRMRSKASQLMELKDLREIEFKDCNRGTPFVVALHNVYSVHKVFSNTKPRDEPNLVGVHKVGDEVPNPQS
jgi:hypothetical protein